jgi:hypothetical protein
MVFLLVGCLCVCNIASFWRLVFLEEKQGDFSWHGVEWESNIFVEFINGIHFSSLKVILLFFPLIGIQSNHCDTFWQLPSSSPANPIIFSSVRLPPFCLFILLGYEDNFP